LRDCLQEGHTASGVSDAKSIQRFLDATDGREFYDVCKELKDYYEGKCDLRKERKRILLRRSIRWNDARWKRAMSELSKMEGWWN
jgi:hypothetical protein